MMREPVAIVLNEREPAKLRAVEDLLGTLQQHDITASRIPITQDVVAVVKQRSPKVLVVDYLLGDYSTGLDILHSLNSVKEERRPRVFFLTDEPSVSVAVEAMRAGAANYYELESADSIKKLAMEIRALLARAAPLVLPRPAAVPNLDEMIGHAPSSRRCLEHATAVAMEHTPIVVVSGPSGSGVTAIAHAVERAGNRGAFCKVVDLRYHTSSMREMTGYPPDREEQLTLGNSLSLIVEHADQDGGELLEYVSTNFSRLWPSKKTSSQGAQLVLCIQDDASIRAWRQLLPIAEIRLPPLDERREDIPPLAMRFYKEAEELGGKKLKPLSTETMQWLASLEWPGNIRQLRSCIIESLLLHLSSDRDLAEIMEDAREISAAQLREETSLTPDALTAAMVLDRVRGSYRIAAAQLGISVTALQNTLRQGVRT